MEDPQFLNEVNASTPSAQIGANQMLTRFEKSPDLTSQDFFRSKYPFQFLQERAVHLKE